MISTSIRRSIQLRPDICTGCAAIGTSALTKSGYISPHIQACIPPIDWPITSLR